MLNPEIASGIPSKEVIVCKIKRICVDLLRYTKAIFRHGKSTLLLTSAILSTGHAKSATFDVPGTYFISGSLD